MKYFFLTLIIAAVAVAGTGCEQVKSTQKEQINPEPAASQQIVTAPETETDDEPLLLEDEPLLLDDEPLLLDDEPLLLLDDGPDEDLSTDSWPTTAAALSATSTTCRRISPSLMHA